MRCKFLQIRRTKAKRKSDSGRLDNAFVDVDLQSIATLEIISE
jgi:hypothetical protein